MGARASGSRGGGPAQNVVCHEHVTACLYQAPAWDPLGIPLAWTYYKITGRGKDKVSLSSLTLRSRICILSERGLKKSCFPALGCEVNFAFGARGVQKVTLPNLKLN